MLYSSRFNGSVILVVISSVRSLVHRLHGPSGEPLALMLIQVQKLRKPQFPYECIMLGYHYQGRGVCGIVTAVAQVSHVLVRKEVEAGLYHSSSAFARGLVTTGS